MKKTYTSILAVTFCLALPIAAFAGQITSTGTTIGTDPFSASKNVTIDVTSAAAAYTAVALHSQGTEEYYILSGNNNINYKTVTAGSTVTNAGATAGSAPAGTYSVK